MQYTEIITDAVTGEVTVRPFTEAEIATAKLAAAPTLAQQQSARQIAYRDEADPLFFKAQRGEATLEEWQAKVAEIKARFPYPAG